VGFQAKGVVDVDGALHYYAPGPLILGKLVSWFPGPLKLQFLFAFFFGAREDQPVLLRSRAICRLSWIFSEILQDRHRPPSDLADGLMRNSSSGQKWLIGQKSGILRSLGEDFTGRQPLAWQTQFFF
jgi:hypothetical protein